MRNTRLAGAMLVTLAGCNAVFDIGPTELASDEASDIDGDTVPDSLDNCVSIANPAQEDLDADGKGDVCDNCSFSRNADQSDVDADQIGDICDPHPEHGGDCLVLVDTFGDPTAFSRHWRLLVAAGDTAEVTPSPGSVQLQPHAPSKIGMVALADDGNVLDGVFDVELRGTVALSDTGSVTAVSNASGLTSGYWCSLRGGINGDGLVVASATGTTAPSAYSAPLSSAAVGDTYVVRLRSTDPVAMPYPDQCRVDYGVAVGARTVTPQQRPTGGGAGVMAERDRTEIKAIALYQYATPCPEPIAR